MSLVTVANLETESEVAVAISLLMANDIPHLVQNRGFGSLFPGPQIGSHSRRRVMVPESYAAEAKELLSVFTPR